MEEAAIRAPRVAIRYFDGCPNWQTTLAQVKQVLDELGASPEVTLERVETPEDAERLRFVGSPTILLDGLDPFEEPGASHALACRIYRTPSGLAGAPTVEQLRDALAEFLDHATS